MKHLPIERFYLVLLILSGIIVGGIYLLPLLYPFIIGLLIAILLNRPVTALQRWFFLPRWLAILFLLLLVITLFFSLITLLVTQAILESTALNSRLMQAIENLAAQFQQQLGMKHWSGWFKSVEEFLTQFSPQLQIAFQHNLEQLLATITEMSKHWLSTLLTQMGKWISLLSDATTAFFFSLLAAFFIANDYERIKEGLFAIIPSKHQQSLQMVYADLHHALFGFFRAQFILVSLTVLMLSSGFLLLQVEHGLTIALMMGLVDLIPYIGIGVIMIPWLLSSYFLSDYKMVIGLATLYALILLTRQIVEPRLMAATIGLNPLLTLLSLFLGLQLFGFIGLLIGPILYVILLSLWNAGIFHDLWAYIRHG